ncbi:MAG: L,D-transpeptidase [Elusimicrobiales bacterium]|nr:L,D-transpeptidase [Elusimicrobiales bacterium]
MATVKAVPALLLLFLGNALAFDLPGLEKGPAPSRLPEVGQPASAYGEEAGLAALRAEAAADPVKFLDEHSPAEIGLAYGLPPVSRFRIDNEAAAKASVRLIVNLTDQRLLVLSPEFKGLFKISSGLGPDNITPGSGRCYAPDFIEEMHYSSLYNKAPMPNSIFFNGNIAMHGTNAEQLLGQPASHGCVRLSKADAKAVYDAVKAHGKSNASICVTGTTPAR